MASSSDVLPWSTWPMMVTTGARDCWCSSSSVSPMKPSSTSASDTRLGVWPNSVHDQLGGIGVDHVVDLVHLALLHQELDDVDGALGHAVGELLDGDHLGNDHLAHDLVARLRHAHRLAASRARACGLQRGQRTLALLLVEGVVDRELDALARSSATFSRAGGRPCRRASWRRGCRRPPSLDGNWAGQRGRTPPGSLFLGDGRGCRRFGTGRACELVVFGRPPSRVRKAVSLRPRRARTLSCGPWRRRRRARADGGTRSRGLRLLRCRHGGSRGGCRLGPERWRPGSPARLCSHRSGWRAAGAQQVPQPA